MHGDFPIHFDGHVFVKQVVKTEKQLLQVSRHFVERNDTGMSETKAQGKGSDAAKKAPVEKAGSGQKASGDAPKTAETAPAAKSNATPKSASQTSTSHFSSVSTPAYKEGWESIFGGAKSARKKATKKDDGERFPDRLTIRDDEIDSELRAALYKAFQRQARKQGVRLAKIKKQADFEYSLDCDIRPK